MYTEGTGLIGGGGHHAAPVWGATHDDGLAAIFGMVALLDTSVEGVQVKMQDRSCFFFVHVPHSLSAPTITHRYHCTSIKESFSQ